MIDKEVINRLGFDAWAQNVFTNAIEDFSSTFGGVGNISIENEDWSYNINWNDKFINFSLRAYTEEGWEEYSNEIKR